MKALILVGGFGTRLMPLTTTVPKPLVPFCNKPMMLYQVEALVKVGVTEVILAVNYRSDVFQQWLSAWAQQYGIKFTVSQEQQPMGTGGPLALARGLLEAGDPREPFFVLNSDVVCGFQEFGVFEKMLAVHRAHGREGTILTTRVADPSKYGVVVHDAAGLIQRFVEKPKEFVGDEINAGVYVLSKRMLARIPSRPTSIEKETFPAMAAARELQCTALDGFWMDVGQPRDYLRGQSEFMRFGRERHAQAEAEAEAARPSPLAIVRGCCLIEPSAVIGRGCVLGPDAVIGARVIIGDGAYVQRSAVFAEARVEAGARVHSSLVGWRAQVGANARVFGAVLGEGVEVEPGAAVFECRVPRPLVENATDGTRRTASRHADNAEQLAAVRAAAAERLCTPALANDAAGAAAARAEAEALAAEVAAYAAPLDARHLAGDDYPQSLHALLDAACPHAAAAL